MDRLCPVCGSRKVRAASTYKHSWLWCSDCGCASRGPNHPYLFAQLPPKVRKVLVRLLPRLRYLLPDSEGPRDGSVLYDQMAAHGYINEGDMSREYFIFSQWMADRLNTAVKGKRILDISGGNGYLLRQMQRAGADCVLTEYNQNAVDYAREVFGLESYVYDFREDIARIVPGQFHIVMLRAALMYCEDLGGFLRSLRPKLHEGARIIVFVSTAPTLGAMLRFQLQDYTYLRLYSPRTVIRIFEENGYQLLLHDANQPVHYAAGTSWLSRLFHLLFELPVGLACGDFQRVGQSYNYLFQLR